MAGAQGKAEKQGYLGNLENKPRTELQDLLNRQEKLLANKQFIGRLPDRGARIQALADRLRSILALHTKVDHTADLLQEMAIEADHKHRSRASVKPAAAAQDEDVLQQIINVESSHKMVEDERADTERRTFINSYEKVVRDIDKQQVQRGAAPPENKFQPNRSINAEHVRQVSQFKLQKLKQSKPSAPPDPTWGKHESESQTQGHTNNVHQMLSQTSKSSDSNKTSLEYKSPRKTLQDSIPSGGTVEGTRLDGSVGLAGLQHRYDDSLEMDMHRGPLQHRPAQLITVIESVKVLEQQQKLHKELQARHAAERLAQRLHINMSEFNPEGAPPSITTYRDVVEDTSDAEHSDTSLDYPD